MGRVLPKKGEPVVAWPGPTTYVSKFQCATSSCFQRPPQVGQRPACSGARDVVTVQRGSLARIGPAFRPGRFRRVVAPQHRSVDTAKPRRTAHWTVLPVPGPALDRRELVL